MILINFNLLDNIQETVNFLKYINFKNNNMEKKSNYKTSKIAKNKIKMKILTIKPY